MLATLLAKLPAISDENSEISRTLYRLTSKMMPAIMTLSLQYFYMRDETTYKGVHVSRCQRLDFNTNGDSDLQFFWSVCKDMAGKAAGTYGVQSFHDRLYYTET